MNILIGTELDVTFVLLKVLCIFSWWIPRVKLLTLASCYCRYCETLNLDLALSKISNSKRTESHEKTTRCPNMFYQFEYIEYILLYMFYCTTRILPGFESHGPKSVPHTPRTESRRRRQTLSAHLGQIVHRYTGSWPANAMVWKRFCAQRCTEMSIVSQCWSTKIHKKWHIK